MLMRLPLPARRVFRLTLATGLATFVVYAAAVPIGYLVIIITLVLASAPGPPPGLKAAAALIAIIGVTMLYGMLLGRAPVTSSSSARTATFWKVLVRLW